MIYYEQKEKKSFGFLIICLFLAVIIYVLVNLINKVDYNLTILDKKETSEVTSYSSNEINLQNLINNSMYSIVGISKLEEKSTSSFSNNEEDILGMCTGIIISQEGYVLTNRHVAGGLYSTCYVNLVNGENYKAEVVWEDDNLDIAILKTNAIKLPSMSFANCEECILGERIYLLSNYTGYDLQKTVEEGIISKIDNTFKAKENNEEYYVENIMKIDTDINENNTGGAVINENGELIGIVSSDNDILVPISRINNVIIKLLEDKRCEKIDLGIYGFGTEVVNYLADDVELEHGVYIEKIEEDSILKKLIEEGEIITRVDGIEVSKMSEIKEYAYSKKVGETIIFSVIRDNVEKDIEIAL